MRNLIILDINGTLLLRNKKLGTLIKRNGLDEFLKFCFSVADVGIYTSMLGKNINMNDFFGEFADKFLFVWDRKYTPIDRMGNGWDTIKSLQIIKREFFYDNYILIDDTYKKVRYIPLENLVLCKSMKENEEDEILKYVQKEIEKKLL